ncbi:uncharacterized protein LAESUDRAFT_736057 [Laetiporus sulphureus 93-53]|uniref:DUF7587 domain-containing protein n=1 Tax=Laetiporus sulphureus 93-53 TaxID=1314785 RepID=A0A165F0X5_9APHY|nr:uncharacterized protein LAESUDRAFT_736057 [Laetiporus sulphureus 93-53]KZT08133.1 hypothetical protein LAESUDRAFT_736057 [Laetiporus sulphureus 93-53]
MTTLTNAGNASTPTPIAEDHGALPQYGFGPDVEFEKLIDSNPFLFRVYTPKETAHNDRDEPCFIGPRFEEDFGSTSFTCEGSDSSPYRSPPESTYADVVQHLDWTTRSSSPYVSTSFSFAWAIWEATRRYHFGMKHSVEIAVIDAKAVAGRAVTAVELLRKAAPKGRHQDHWKWYRFALEAQDVLVWGYIPGSAVFASIPLSQLVAKLPSYFLSMDAPDVKDSLMSRLGWNYTLKRPSYRQFCQDMSERFLRMPVDRRLRDTTAGSVRLALCHLRPWFHRLAIEDFTTATVTVCELAFVIARWSGQWWVREHPEIQGLIRCMVHIVGEEVREARRVQALADASRMQEIVGGIEQLAETYQMRSRLQKASGAESQSSSAETEPSAVETRNTAAQPAKPVSPALTVQTAPRELDLEKATPVDDEVVPPARPSSGSSYYGSFARLVSCLLTGFLVGTFFTLCILAPDKREIAHHLT